MLKKDFIPRKQFTVVIENRQYDVYDLGDRKHAGDNGTIESWWLYHANRLPEGQVPDIDAKEFVPFDVSINRTPWTITFEQVNTTKEKWNSTHFRNHTKVEMKCNGKVIYRFTTTGTDKGLAFAMAKVQYLQVMLAEHSFNFFDPESENGRKIYWYGMPAFVKTKSGYYPWEIQIIPDYGVGFAKEEWWKEYRNRKKKLAYTPTEDDANMDENEREDEDQDKDQDSINWGDAFSDGNIDWFRN